MEMKWKLETETGNGKWKWKWKLETEMEMRQSLAQGVAHAQVRYCARHRVEMVLCAAMEGLQEGTESSTESSPIDLEGWRAVGLGCASNPIVLDDEDSFTSSGSDFE